jgi:hypothetical protein
MAMTFAPGFDLTEALDLLAMSAIIEGGAAPPVPNPPPGWTLLFTSPPIGPFDNMWQLWRRDADGAFSVAIRGTVSEAGSILEDLISLMIAATGSMKIGPLRVDYKFAESALAGVHLGFALGALLLLKDQANGILAQLQAHGAGPGSSVYVTGHSQGAAVATLVRSYLAHAADAPVNVSYKTYIYAQPKPGNDHYADDFESRFSNAGLAFRVTNSLDWVPQVPFTLEFIQDINTPNPLSVLGSKSLLMVMLDKLFDEIRTLVRAHAHARLHTTALALAQRAAPATAPAGGLLIAFPFEVPEMPSFNFVNAGAGVALIGTPCIGAECQDAFFEHHAVTYYVLLQAQRPVA